MQQVVIQLPASVLSALSPQKASAAQSQGITFVQPMSVGMSGNQPQAAVTDDSSNLITSEGQQFFAIQTNDQSGGTIQISAAQLQSLLQPSVTKQQ